MLWQRVHPFSKHDRLQVAITASPPDRRRRDLDNILKATLDSLQHAGLYPDDSQIDALFVIRGQIVKGGSLQVELSILRSDDDQGD